MIRHKQKNLSTRTFELLSPASSVVDVYQATLCTFCVHVSVRVQVSVCLYQFEDSLHYQVTESGTE